MRALSEEDTESVLLIRPVSEKDAAAISGIYNHYVENTAVSFETEMVSAYEMQQRIKELSSAYPYYVLEEDGEVIGYAYVHQWKERAAYSRTVEATVYLHKDHCGRKLAGLLMRKVIDGCRECGVHAIIACITSVNTASLRFFESLAFKKVSQFPEVGYKFGRWYGVIDCELLI